jgi:hypothetical protein
MIMGTRRITIELPEAIFRRFNLVARAIHQPLEALVTQSVIGNLPPQVETPPPYLQSELLGLYSLSTEALIAITVAEMETAQRQRQIELTKKSESNEERLTSEEYQELANLRLNFNRLLLRKAYAWEILRWRGQRMPSVYEMLDPLS